MFQSSHRTLVITHTERVVVDHVTVKSIRIFQLLDYFLLPANL